MTDNAAERVVLVGPITGVVTLEDGTGVNVTPDQVPVDHLSDEQVEELAHLVAMHYYTNGHPNDVETDDEGNPVQRPFNYDNPPERFASAMKKATQAGTPHTTSKK